MAGAEEGLLSPLFRGVPCVCTDDPPTSSCPCASVGAEQSSTTGSVGHPGLGSDAPRVADQHPLAIEIRDR